MSIGPDAEQLHVDTAGTRDCRLVAGRLSRYVRRLAVRSVDAVEVDMVGELMADHRVIGLGVLAGEPDVLVKQERPGAREAQRPVAVTTDQLAVDRQWGRAGGQA